VEVSARFQYGRVLQGFRLSPRRRGDRTDRAPPNGKIAYSAPASRWGNFGPAVSSVNARVMSREGRAGSKRQLWPLLTVSRTRSRIHTTSGRLYAIRPERITPDGGKRGRGRGRR